MFDQKGVVTLTGKIDEDGLLEASMEGEADSYELFEDEEEMGAEVFTDVTNLDILTKVLKDKNFNITEAELKWIPNNKVEVNDPDQAKFLLRLMDVLESLDDVQNVTANFEISDELMDLFF
jgi:transcriptional/translational regulatory protein YebC/TACO1